MTVLLDPVTRQRIVVDQFVGDVIYGRKGDSAIADESKKVIGPWKDFTGTGGQGTKTKLMNPKPNQFEGTDEGIEGNRLGNLNEIGQDSNIYRRRQLRILRKLNKNENSVIVQKD